MVFIFQAMILPSRW